MTRKRVDRVASADYAWPHDGDDLAAVRRLVGPQKHCALLWGGTAFNFGRKPERLQSYVDATARPREIAKLQGVDVFISNHNTYDDSVAKLAAKTSDGPNPFVLGAPTAQRALTVMNECA